MKPTSMPDACRLPPDMIKTPFAASATIILVVLTVPPLRTKVPLPYSPIFSPTALRPPEIISTLPWFPHMDPRLRLSHTCPAWVIVTVPPLATYAASLAVGTRFPAQFEATDQSPDCPAGRIQLTVCAVRVQRRP